MDSHQSILPSMHFSTQPFQGPQIKSLKCTHHIDRFSVSFYRVSNLCVFPGWLNLSICEDFPSQNNINCESGNKIKFQFCCQNQDLISSLSHTIGKVCKFRLKILIKQFKVVCHYHLPPLMLIETPNLLLKFNANSMH